MVAQEFTRKVVRVPDVAGKPLEKAKILLEDAGLGKMVVLFRESYEDPDTVLEQRPARGQMVYEGSEVTLWIARRGYLEHLPAIYRRSDAVGRNVVRDMCFLFEHMLGSVERTLERAHSFYDPHETRDMWREAIEHVVQPAQERAARADVAGLHRRDERRDLRVVRRDVHPRRERAAGAGQHHRARRRRVQLVRRPPEPRPHRLAERVLALRPIEGDHRDRAAALDVNRAFRHARKVAYLPGCHRAGRHLVRRA